MRVWLSSAAIAAFALVGAVVLSVAGASADSWSTPVALSSCGAATQPQVVFPFSAPNVRSGVGAVLWLGGTAGCAGGAGAGTATTIDAAALDSADQPGAPRALLTGAAAYTSVVAPLHALGTTAGEVIAIAGARGMASLGSPEAVAGDASVVDGIETLRALDGPDTPVATMNGFIGDADVATVSAAAGGGYEIVVRAQRHYATAFSGRRRLPVGAGPITALAIGMDYRADRLVVWAQRGEVWAQYISNDGRIESRQLLGPSGYDPQIAAVLSDDDRAFVIWTDEPPPGSSAVTNVMLAHSAVGPRFHGAQTLASFTEPAGVRLGGGAVAAERLSSEGVVLLWPAMANGNYQVDAAGASETGVQAPSILAEPGQDVRLGAVATGPDSEIAVLVEVAPRTAAGFDQSHQELLATRSNLVHGAPGLGFGPLSLIAPSGPNVDPSVAVDPDTDTAVAAWQTTSAAGVPQVDYSIGTAAAAG